MNENGFNFIYEVLCNYCTELPNCNRLDIELLAEIRKLLRVWHEQYKERLTKELFIDE